MTSTNAQEPLSRTNARNWLQNSQYQLRAKKLWDVTVDERTLEDFDNPAIKECVKWKEQTSEALGVIGLLVGKDFQPWIEGCKTAHEAWTTIETKTTTGSAMAVNSIYKELHTKG